MPQAAKKVESTGDAQGRFVVSLPKEVGAQIDKLIAKTAERLREEIGVGVEVTRPQMVQSLVQDALASASKREAERNADS